jgi:multidrug efflux pump subunit AcrB
MLFKTRTLPLVVVALSLIGGSPRTKQQAGPSPRPTITIRAVYPGANARVVADVIAAPVEEQVNGAPGMLHMVSRCTKDGTYTLTILFKPGTDLDKAQVLVNKRVLLAQPVLPDVVKQRGVAVKKGSPGILMLIALRSPDGSRDVLWLSSYAAIQLQDVLVRTAGVAELVLLGMREYSVRVWLDPEKLAARDLAESDVLRSIRKQIGPAAGKAERQPAGKGKGGPIFVMSLGRLAGVGQLEEIILKTTPQGNVIRLRDVARVELGTGSPESYAALNGKAAVLLAVYPTARASPRTVSAAVRDRLSALRRRLPRGMTLDVAFDFAPNLEGQERAAPPGYLLLDLDLPPGASPERLAKVLDQCAARLREVKGVGDVLALSENPFDRHRDQPCILIGLRAMDQRPAGREPLIRAVRARLRVVAGLTLRVRDLSGPGALARGGYPIDLALHGPEADGVREWAKKLGGRLRRSQELTDLWVNPDATPRPQLHVVIDRTAAADLGVSVQDVFDVLQIYCGSLDVSNVQHLGRTWQVVVRADTGARDRAKNLRRLKVRNAKGQMVPLGSLARIHETEAPAAINRLGGEPMIQITANPAPGVQPARACHLCEQQAEKVRKELRLPANYRLTRLRDLPAQK